MSRIQALDEISAQLGPPVLLRWIDAPYGATAAVVRFRHRGGVIELNPSRAFRLIFQISPSEVMLEETKQAPAREIRRPGSIITSFTDRPERIRIAGAADTLQLLFSPELAAARITTSELPAPHIRRDLLASAAQALVTAGLDGTDTPLRQTVFSIARLVAEQKHEAAKAGGLAPQASRIIVEMLEQRLHDGVTVSELAQAANLSLHHFIKVCHHTEGLTRHALLIQMRIERSIEMLLMGSATVDEVAMRVGFFSPAHFVSTFRRLVGVTPAALRRAARFRPSAGIIAIS